MRSVSRLRPCLRAAARRVLPLLLALPVLLALVPEARAQVTVQVFVKSPLPRSLDVWQNDPSLVRVTLVNTSGQALGPLRFSFKVTGAQRGEVLRSVDGHPQQPTFSLGPGEARLFVVDELTNPSAITVASGLAQEVAKDGLPEDQYTFCASVLSGGATVGSTGALCPTFTVAEPDPPELVSPAPGVQVNPVSLTFSWAFTNVPGGPLPTYRLRIKPLLAGQTPVAAMQSNPTFFEEDVAGKSYFYLPSDPAFSTFPNAVGWVWQVQARTFDGKPYGRNQGLSKVERFTLPAPVVLADAPPPPAPVGGTACLSGCVGAAPQNQTVATAGPSAFVGKTIRFGKFLVTVTAATGSASSMSGSGTVAVPFLKAPLRVALENVKVNTTSEAIGGRAVAVADGAAVPGEWKSAFGGTFGAGARAAIAAVADQVEAEGRTVTALAGSTPVALPLGIDRSLGGSTWSVLLVGAEFTPTAARVNAVLDVPLPAYNDRLALGARGLCINPEGLGAEATLVLTEQVQLSLRDQPGVDNDLTATFLAAATGEPGTRATWGCEGFKQLNVALTQDLPRDALVPVTDAGVVQPGRVRARFAFATDSIDDWVATGTVAGRAMVPDVPDLLLDLPSVVFDNSATRNPQGLVFPEGYKGLGGPAWTGLYVPQATLYLPTMLRRAGSTARLTGTASHVLIGSGGGVTFTASLSNLLTLGNAAGTLDGWAFSLDQVTVQVVSSSLVKGSLGGQLRVPVGDTPLQYTASLSHKPGASSLGYLFVASPVDTYAATLFGPATLRIDKTSAIEVGNIGPGGTFLAQARLNGSFTLSGTSGNVPVNLSGIGFQNFVLRSRAAPAYVEPGTWSFASPQHTLGDGGSVANGSTAEEADKTTAGFPVTLTSFQAVTDTKAGTPRVGLKVGMKVTLPASFEANTTFSVWGRLNRDAQQNFRPAYDETVLDQVCVAGDIGVMEVEKGSCLTFFQNNATYGNGFNGTVKANFLKSVKVSTTLSFGAASGFTYWYADALATLPQGIPIAPTPLAFYGFGGGAYYHMRQQNLPSATSVQSGGSARPTYVPDASVGLGLKATVVAGTFPRPDVFNADVTLDVAFSSGGGVQTVSLGAPPGTYNAVAFAGLSASERAGAPAKAGVFISYDFPNRVFDATFALNVNTAAGLVTAKGDAALHFAGSEDWFVRVGTPTPGQRFALKTGIMTFDAYLWVGKTPGPVPEMPDPPYPAPAISAKNRPSFSDMQGGTALLLGASTGYHAEGKFAIFYGKVDAVAGFDLSLRDYGDATCAGLPGVVGMRGWYATGQLYAGLAVAVGIDVDVWFTSGRFEIFNASLGATLAGGGPNPSWAAGIVKGKYSILKGLVRGSMTYETRIGQECTPTPSFGPVESPLVAVDLIAEISPASNTQNVSVFSEPTAAFNIEIGQSFDLRDSNGKLRSFRVMLDPIELRKGQTASGTPVPGSTTTVSGGESAYFSREAPLDGQSWYFGRVSVYGQERKGGAWVTATDLSGKPIRQQRTVLFRTGDAPTTIQPEHIAALLPRDGQRSFIRSCAQGSVRLWEDYRYLTNRLPSEPAGATFALVARFQRAGATTWTDVPVQMSAQWVTFTLPTLPPQTAYTLSLVRVPTSGAMTTATTYLAALQTQNLGQGATLEGSRRRITGQRVRPGERVVLQSVFQTSRFASLDQKIASISTGATRLTSNHSVAADASMVERFDRFDLFGSTSTYKGKSYTAPALVQIDAPWENAWATNDATPDIYAFRRSIPQHSDYLPPCSLSGPDEECWAQHPIQYLNWNAWALPAERRQTNQTAGTDVVFGGTKPYDLPLTAAEVAASGQPSGSGGSGAASYYGYGFAGGGGLTGAWTGGWSPPYSTQAALTITHQHGRWAYLDRQTMLPWLNKAEISVYTDGEPVNTSVPYSGPPCPKGYNCGPKYFTGYVRTLDPAYDFQWITNLAYYHNVWGFTEPKGPFRIRFRATSEQCSLTNTPSLILTR